MELLRALLHDLDRDAGAILQHLGDVDADPDTRDHAIGAYRLVEAARRNARTLLRDPALGRADLIRNQLFLYQAWRRAVWLAEEFPLPFIERYGETDRRLTRLCTRLLEQVAWPGDVPRPIVGAFSTQYYWSQASFSIICAPATEADRLLGLPDLCHELGHLLLAHRQATLEGDFRKLLEQYVEEVGDRARARAEPGEFHQRLEVVRSQWLDEWMREFICDMVATYLVGPPYGYQHLRLSTGGLRPAFAPGFGQLDTHPADEARMRAILAALRLMGSDRDGDRVREHWNAFMSATGARPTAGYDHCYPDRLINGLAERCVEGCRTLGLRPFTEAHSSPGTIGVMLRTAWDRFLADPSGYRTWEEQALRSLWADLAKA